MKTTYAITRLVALAFVIAGSLVAVAALAEGGVRLDKMQPENAKPESVEQHVMKPHTRGIRTKADTMNSAQIESDGLNSTHTGEGALGSRQK
ncbi:MAG: hypothetical protein ACREC0_06355 [Methylocella sp.]